MDDMTGSKRDTLIAPRGEPVWKIAEFLPEQGGWTEPQYLRLMTERGIEFNDGMIEILPVPTKTHQLIVLLLCDLLRAFVTKAGLGGLVLQAGYRVRIPSRKYREPDVVYMTAEQN